MTTQGRQLEGKVALITGAARNIGRTIAMTLAADGAAVVINALSAAEALQAVAQEIRDAGGRALAVLGDVGDQATAEKLVADAVAEFGRLDILVNNAARRRTVPTLETSLELWHDILGTILDGSFLCAKYSLPHLIKSGGGRIINLGGGSAHRGVGDHVAVMTAKMGVIGLTRSLAFDFASQGVTANCIVPGGIDTRRGAAAGGGATDARNIPVGRKGRPQEIAELIRMLCGPNGGFITGQTIHVSGGMFFG